VREKPKKQGHANQIVDRFAKLKAAKKLKNKAKPWEIYDLSEWEFDASAQFPCIRQRGHPENTVQAGLLDVFEA